MVAPRLAGEKRHGTRCGNVRADEVCPDGLRLPANDVDRSAAVRSHRRSPSSPRARRPPCRWPGSGSCGAPARRGPRRGERAGGGAGTAVALAHALPGRGAAADRARPPRLLRLAQLRRPRRGGAHLAPAHPRRAPGAPGAAGRHRRAGLGGLAPPRGAAPLAGRAAGRRGAALRPARGLDRQLRPARHQRRDPLRAGKPGGGGRLPPLPALGAGRARARLRQPRRRDPDVTSTPLARGPRASSTPSP